MSSVADGLWAKVQWRDREYDIHVPNAETDYIQGRLLKESVPYEVGLLTEFSERVSPGDLALDVGANVGNHTLFLACALGCRVEAFEPDGYLVRAIEESLKRNGVTHLVRTHRAAVGATRSQGRLVCDDPSNLGGQRMVAIAESSTDDDAENIDIITLDEMAFSAPVRLIKVDVEGAELDVLIGAASLLERDQPLVYVECLTGADFAEVETWLGDRGYLWVGVWNASPTHCFVHREQLPAFADFRGRLRAEALTHYELVEQARDLQQQLDRANLMYRSLTQQVGSEVAPRDGDLAVVLSSAEGLRLQVEQLTRDLANTRNEMVRRLDMRDSRLSWAESELHRRLRENAETLGSLRAGLAAERDRWESTQGRLEAEKKAHVATAAALEDRSAQLAEAIALLTSHETARSDVAAELEARSSELEACMAELRAVRAEKVAAEDLASRTQTNVADLEARAVEAERISNDLGQTVIELRTRLEHGTQRHERVRRDLRVVRQHIEAQRERAVELTDQIAKAEADLEAQRSQRAEAEACLRAEIQAERARHEDSARESRDALRREQDRSREVEDQLREELRLSRNQRDTYRRNLIGLRTSGTYLLGVAIRDAVKSPRGLVRLVPELRRALRAAKEQRS